VALKFFRIPAEGSAVIEAELNAFLTVHKVLRVARELVERDSSPGWAVCVEYLPGVAPAAGSSGAGAASSKVEGIGEARVEKYGAAVLALFERNGQPGNEADVTGA
jgi:hypothetical protein